MIGTEFIPGDAVEKHTGDYRWRGTVRAVFTVFDGGPERIVVSHPVPPESGSGYVLHIYAPGNLRHVVEAL